MYRLAFNAVVSPNTKVHSVLTMLSPIKHGKKFDIITCTFVFHRVSRHLYDNCLQAAVPCTDALQYVDEILTLLHSFIEHDGSCAHTYIIQTLARYQTVIVEITCLAMIGNYLCSSICLY